MGGGLRRGSNYPNGIQVRHVGFLVAVILSNPDERQQARYEADRTAYRAPSRFNLH